MVDAVAAVENFLPSRNAFAFTNSFPHQPVLTVPLPGLGRIPIGDASRGLCGGMIYAVRDLYEAGRPVPADRVAPPTDSPLYRYIVRRLFDSFDIPLGVGRYYRLMGAPDADGSRPLPPTRGLGRITAVEEWPRVRLDLDQGVLSPLGIITRHSRDPFALGHNHQVLAYAYEQRRTVVRLRVYDPNTRWDDTDDVELLFDLDRPGRGMVINHNVSIGTSPIRGFFRSRYRFRDPSEIVGPSSR